MSTRHGSPNPKSIVDTVIEYGCCANVPVEGYDGMTLEDTLKDLVDRQAFTVTSTAFKENRRFIMFLSDRHDTHYALQGYEPL